MWQNKRFWGNILLGLLSFSLINCSPKPVETPIAKGEPRAEIDKFAGTGGWEVEWERVQKEARKEGKVILYSTIGSDVRQALSEALKEYGLELEVVGGRGGELAEKLLREHRVGIRYVDLYIAGANTIVERIKPAGILASLEPLLILPEVKDPKMWYKGQLPFVDKEKSILHFAAYPSGEIHINTDIIKSGDINSMQDLLSVRWSGKIIMDYPIGQGRGNQWVAVVIISMGEDYMKQLARQNPIITRDQRQLMDWVAKGRVPIGLGGDPDLFIEYKKAGAHLDTLLLKEALYITAGSGYVIYIDGAPHPNASRVFLNWLLSKKGQTMWSLLKEAQSTRIDTPVDHLKASDKLIRQPGVEYIETIDEKWLLELKPKMDKIIMEVFTPLVR